MNVAGRQEAWESWEGGSKRAERRVGSVGAAGRREQGKRIMIEERIVYEILSVVEEIPEGKVATYGQIADLIGRPRNARLVGKVLSMAEYYGKYPCHRVVNHAGRTAPGWREQRFLLEEEGVEMKANGLVDLKKYRWEC